MKTVELREGDRVRWVTGDALATVVRIRPYGDVAILVDGASVHTDTRACYLEPLV